MLENSSHLLSLNEVLSNYNIQCLVSSPSRFIYTAYSLSVGLLLLPLCAFVLHSAIRQFWTRRAASSSPSHFNIFTYNLVLVELVIVFSSFMYTFGVYQKTYRIIFVTWSTICAIVGLVGQVWFHLLICAERYLAVVHPIIYLRSSKKNGTQMRNVAIGLVWFLFAANVGTAMLGNVYVFMIISFLVFSLVFISFFSGSVFYVLIRPGTGMTREHLRRVDQSKRRALYAIVVILCTLVLRFFGCLFWFAFYMYGEDYHCILMAGSSWLNLPSSLVIPLQFLQREKKLAFGKKRLQRTKNKTATEKNLQGNKVHVVSH